MYARLGMKRALGLGRDARQELTRHSMVSAYAVHAYAQKLLC